VSFGVETWKHLNTPLRLLSGIVIMGRSLRRIKKQKPRIVKRKKKVPFKKSKVPLEISQQSQDIEAKLGLR
jgi:hypothetical protein